MSQQTAQADTRGASASAPRPRARRAHMPGLRHLVRLLSAAAVILAALGFAGTAMGAPAQTDPTIGRPAVFAGMAAASAVFQTTDRNNGISAVAQPVYTSFPDATSVFASNTLNALGSLYYPGLTVSNLGTLICVAGGPCNIPPYPLDANADGNHPSASVKLSGTLGGAGALLTLLGGGADAAASITGTASDANVTGYDAGPAMTSAQSAAVTSFLHQAALLTGTKVAATSSAMVHVQSMEAHTHQAFEHTATLVDHAESRLSGIDLLGGMIHIDSIFATSTAQNDGVSVRSHDDNVTMSGVTVAGQPASIGSNGVTINGSGQGKAVLDTLNTGLQQALAAAGVQLHAVGHTDARSSLQPQRCSAGEVDGLELYAPVNITPVPVAGDVYHTEIALGSACTDAAAGADRVMADNNADQVPPVAATTPPPSFNDVGTPSVDLTASPAGPPVIRSPRRIVRRTQHRSSLEADLRGSLVTHRVELLYLAFTVAFVALCLGTMPFIPSRLPAGP